MSKGLRIPLGVNATGGTATVEGDEQASKIILMALGDNDSDNAFQQDLGLGSRAVFRLNSASFRAWVENRIKTLFEEFERLRLYKLDETTVEWSRPGEGEARIDFKYLNMESDEEQSFAKTFKSGA